MRGAVAHRRTWASKRREEAQDFIRSMDAQNARFDREEAREDAALPETVTRQMRDRGRGVPTHMSPEGARVPVLLERACAVANNISALECLGELRDHQGDHARARTRRGKKPPCSAAPSGSSSWVRFFTAGWGTTAWTARRPYFGSRRR